MRGSASQAMRPHPCRLRHRIHAAEGPATSPTPPLDSWAVRMQKAPQLFFGGKDAERSSALSKQLQRPLPLQRPPQQPLQKPRQQLQARPLPLPLPRPHPNQHLDRSRSQATDRSALSARQPNWRSSRCSGYSLAPRPCVQVRRVWVGRALHRMDAVAELTWVRAHCLRGTASHASERTAASGWAGPRSGTCSVPCQPTHDAPHQGTRSPRPFASASASASASALALDLDRDLAPDVALRS